MTAILSKSENGVQINNSPLTTGLTNSNSTLLLNEIDNRIVKIRPMATPIDQLSRCGDVRHAGSMKVNYYAVDVKDVKTKIKVAPTANDVNICVDDSIEIAIITLKNQIFSKTETVLVPSVVFDDMPLMLYVTDVTELKVTFRTINPDLDAGEVRAMLKIGTELVRMGRAASELDVQTPQFEALPHKNSNQCQIFKMQVEESTLHRLSNKEAGWTFSDQEEVAVIDMRQGMEKNFLFGIGGIIPNPLTGDDIYLTQGIWNQKGLRDFSYNADELTEDDLINLCRKAFTGTNGSARKILIGGSALIEALSRIKKERIVTGVQTLVRWGLEFHEIKSNFGTLHVIHSEIFDQCGHEADGMIIDPNLLTKWVHIPFAIEKLDLRSTGQRNTDAVVLTEASCLVLRNPASHMRIKALGAQRYSLNANSDNSDE